MATITWSDLLQSVTINYSTTPPAVVEFNKVLLIVDKATNSLDGERVVTYTSYAAMQADNTAGFISAATLATGLDVFSQRLSGKSPPAFMVGNVDLVGSETYAQALTAIDLVDSSFYGVVINNRTQSVIVAVATAVETFSRPLLFGFQDDDSSWLNSGVPSAYSGIVDYNRTVGLYHTTDAQPGDVIMMVKGLMPDPDEQSGPWRSFSIEGIDAYTTAPTAAQVEAAMDNNINLMLPWGGKDAVINPGVALSGRSVSEVVTGDWLATRMKENVATLAVQRADRGQKVGMNVEGQTLVLAEIEALLSQGVTVGHFESGQTLATAETIADTDRTNRELQFTVSAQVVDSALRFNFTVSFSTTPITE